MSIKFKLKPKQNKFYKIMKNNKINKHRKLKFRQRYLEIAILIL